MWSGAGRFETDNLLESTALTVFGRAPYTRMCLGLTVLLSGLVSESRTPDAEPFTCNVEAGIITNIIPQG